MRWVEAAMAEVVELVGGGEKKASHVDGEEVGAVAAPHRHRLEQAGVGNAHLHGDHQQEEINHLKLSKIEEEQGRKNLEMDRKGINQKARWI